MGFCGFLLSDHFGFNTICKKLEPEEEPRNVSCFAGREWRRWAMPGPLAAHLEAALSDVFVSPWSNGYFVSDSESEAVPLNETTEQRENLPDLHIDHNGVVDR